MPDPLTTETERGIGWLTIDRPDRYNALDADGMTALAEAVDALATDDAVRCLVVTGADPAFCTGADLGDLDGDASDEPRLEALADALHDAVEGLATAPKPVLAGVNGPVAGGGLGLALAGDVVLVAEGASFTFAYPSIGLSGDGGSTWFLPRLLGPRRATEFAMRNEPIGAEEAATLGLATEAVPPEEFDDRLATRARELADGPTRAYAATKRLMREGLTRDLSSQLDDEAQTIAGLTDTTDYATGLGAFFGDEDPEFVGE